MPCTSLMTDQKSRSRKYCYTISGLLNEREEKGPISSGLNTPSSERTVDCFSCFDLSTVFQVEKKKMICAVYSGYLEREMENISAHGPKKYT